MPGGSSIPSSRAASSDSESEMETVWSIPCGQSERKRRLEDTQHPENPEATGKKAKAEQGDVELIVFMASTNGGSLLKISPLKFGSALQKKVGAVQQVKQITGGRFLIKCSNQKQVKTLLSITSICNTEVTCQLGGQPLQPRGVININEDLSENDLLKALKKVKVTSVKRIISGKDKQPTRSVILTFSTQTLPTEVYLGYQVFKLRMYVPPAPRCFNCQRLGHTSKSCRSKLRCPRCGGQHTYDDCVNKESPTCCNCGGSHSAAYGGCPAKKQADKVQYVRITENISYSQAVKLLHSKESPPVVINSPVPARSTHASFVSGVSTNFVPAQSVATQTEGSAQTQTDTVISDQLMSNLIAFIVDILFTSLKLDKQPDRVKLIMNCVSSHFGPAFTKSVNISKWIQSSSQSAR